VVSIQEQYNLNVSSAAAHFIKLYKFVLTTGLSILLILPISSSLLFLLCITFCRSVGGFRFFMFLERYAGPGKIDGTAFCCNFGILYGT